MLVLSRKLDESIQIRSDVFITIKAIKGGRVQIGIDAPRQIAIRRTELVVGSACAIENGVVENGAVEKGVVENGAIENNLCVVPATSAA